jgi:hypothetical protein
MRGNRKIAGLVLIGGIILALAGCGKKEIAGTEEIEEKEESVSEVVVETETEETDPHEGQVRSFYTGEWIDEELAWNRPVAVMTENTKMAIPQYGLGSADIIYECPVEGGITRLMAIYQDYANLEKVGNVRSCRLYYVYFAREFDAVYFHAGESKYALDLLNSSYIDNVDGITGKGGSFYYRDSSKNAPHNLYTTGEKIAEAIQSYGYDDTLPDDYSAHYRFTTEEAPNLLTDGDDAAVVSLYYIDAKPWFVYNETDGLYERYEFGSAQVDALTGEQLAVKNIILQNCSSYLKDESNGTLEIDYRSGGTGVYITEGKAIGITWSRASDYDITRYYDMDGNEIVLNPGKTWVEIVQSSKTGDNVIYPTAEAFKQ